MIMSEKKSKINKNISKNFSNKESKKNIRYLEIKETLSNIY